MRKLNGGTIMKIGEAIKKAMKAEKITQVQLAEKVGAKSQSVIAERLKMDNISINVIIDMLDAVGYEMVIQPKGNKSESQIIIEK